MITNFHKLCDYLGVPIGVTWVWSRVSSQPITAWPIVGPIPSTASTAYTPESLDYNVKINKFYCVSDPSIALDKLQTVKISCSELHILHSK